MTPRCIEKKSATVILCVKDNESYLSTAMATEKHNLHRLYKTQLTSAFGMTGNLTALLAMQLRGNVLLRC